MAKEYLIPIGIDFKGGDGIREIVGTMDKLSDKGGQVGKTLDEAFSKGAKASEELDKKLKPATKNLETIREVSRLAGKDLADAFKSGNISDFEKRIQTFKDKIASITGTIDIDIPDDKIRIFEKEIANAKDGIDELRIAMAIAGDVMSQLDPASEEFQQMEMAVTSVQETLDTFGNEVVDVVEKSQSMKSELRSIKNELNALEESGQTNSQRFRDLSVRAGELEDQIGDTNAQIRILASDTKNFDAMIDGVTGLVGAFTAVQGAVGLFAGENEELEKALLKVNSAMAILQGLQAVSNTLNKDSAFSVVLLSKAKQADLAITNALTGALGLNTTATGASTLATKAFSFALKTIGIGLIITAIAYLVEYWDELTEAVEDFLPAGQSVGKVFNQIKSYAFGVGNAIVQFVIAPIKALWAVVTTGDVGKGLETYKKGLNVVGSFTDGFNKQQTRNAKAEALKQKEIRMQQWKDQLDIQEAEGKDVSASRRKWLQNNIALLKKQGKDTKDAERELLMSDAKSRGEARKQAEQDAKQRSADAKRQADERKRQAEQDAKDRIEAEKKANEQIKKLADELADAKIRNIEDTADRERKAIEDQFSDKIKSVEDEVALTKEAEKLKADLIIELQKERDAKLKEFDEKSAKEKIQLQLDANKELQNLQKDSLEKELELLDISSTEMENAIREKYKNEESLKLKLLESAEKNKAEKEKEIRDKYAKQALKDDEERALLSVELASQYAIRSEETELQKQIAIQQIKLDFAEKNLQLLLDSGKGENDLEVLRAKKIVQDAQEAVDDAVAKNGNKPFDMLDFLGIGKGLSGDQKKAMKQAFNQIADSLGQLTDFMVEQYDRQIEAKQESIDQLDDEIGNLEDRLEEEKELQEEGFANNVATIEAELAEKQRQKDEEIKQQQELFEKKKQMQKAQVAIDTISQLSNMITASTEIFKALSGIPFVGIPLAIATIGLMFGAFVATKAKALQQINSQKFRYGGEISGKRHESGGVKYYSEDGRNIELEDGEFVFRREKRQKYGRLLDAMNSGNFNGITTDDREVVSLFRELGFGTDLSGMTSAGKELQVALLSIGYNSKDNESLKEINSNIKEMIRLQRETPVTWLEDGFQKTRIGSKVIKVKIVQPIIPEDNDDKK